MVSSVISETQRWNLEDTEAASSVEMLQSEQKTIMSQINQAKAAEEIQRQIQEHFKAAAAATAVQAAKTGPLKSAFSIRSLLNSSSDTTSSDQKEVTNNNEKEDEFGDEYVDVDGEEEEDFEVVNVDGLGGIEIIEKSHISRNYSKEIFRPVKQDEIRSPNRASQILQLLSSHGLANCTHGWGDLSLQIWSSNRPENSLWSFVTKPSTVITIK